MPVHWRSSLETDIGTECLAGGGRRQEEDGGSRSKQLRQTETSLQHLLSWRPWPLDTILRNYTAFSGQGENKWKPCCLGGTRWGTRSGPRALKDASLSSVPFEPCWN